MLCFLNKSMNGLSRSCFASSHVTTMAQMRKDTIDCKIIKCYDYMQLAELAIVGTKDGLFIDAFMRHSIPVSQMIPSQWPLLQRKLTHI